MARPPACVTLYQLRMGAWDMGLVPSPDQGQLLGPNHGQWEGCSRWKEQSTGGSLARGSPKGEVHYGPRTIQNWLGARLIALGDTGQAVVAHKLNSTRCPASGLQPGVPGTAAQAGTRGGWTERTAAHPAQGPCLFHPCTLRETPAPMAAPRRPSCPPLSPAGTVAAHFLVTRGVIICGKV